MLNFPSAERNIEPILQVLRKEIPSGSRRGLELASGSGQHIVRLAKEFPDITWTPSDIQEKHLQSIQAYMNEESLPNVSLPQLLDASLPWSEWPFEQESLDVMTSVNLIHISPFTVCQGLVRAAGSLLKPGGRLIFYGPFREHGVLEPQSNVDFDSSLRSRDISWGIRDVDDVQSECKEAGLALRSRYEMPANNRMFIFEKTV